MARTRAADFADKQNSILASAAAVLAERGMDKASMAQIASHLQVSKALLYHYYPSKDALIFAIIQSHLAGLDAAIAAADRPEEAARTRLLTLVTAVLEAYRGADDAHQVQLNAMRALSEPQRARIGEIERRIVRRFAAVLREINPALDAPDRPLLMPVTMSLFGMLNWVYLWFRDGGPISREEYAEVATALLLDGIMAVR